jgi:hypothetical protein
VPQLYLGFSPVAGEPPKLLKGFQRISLSPGQTQHVTFNLKWEDLANWDLAARGWIVNPGVFQVSVGASSRDIRLTGSFTVSSAIPSSDLADAALHQPITVSSTLSTNTAGSAAVDGDPTTTWTSLAADPQWIAVDLGVIRDLSRVRLQWGTNFATSYEIQTSSDDTNWTDIYSTTSGGGGVEDILVSGRTRYLRVYGTQRAGAAGYSLCELSVFSQAQRPFGGAAYPLPGRIEAENYDTGGEGIAYYNTTVGNAGGVYRSDDVGIQATTDAGGGYDVGWINTGEWLEYTVNPPDPSAIYSISVRVAAASTGGQLRIRLDGTVLGVVTIPNTGGSQTWQTLFLPNVPIQGGSGSKALRLEALGGGFNINWVELDRVQTCSTNNIATVTQPHAGPQLSPILNGYRWIWAPCRVSDGSDSSGRRPLAKVTAFNCQRTGATGPLFTRRQMARAASTIWPRSGAGATCGCTAHNAAHRTAIHSGNLKHIPPRRCHPSTISVLLPEAFLSIPPTTSASPLPLQPTESPPTAFN